MMAVSKTRDHVVNERHVAICERSVVEKSAVNFFPTSIIDFHLNFSRHLEARRRIM